MSNRKSNFLGYVTVECSGEQHRIIIKDRDSLVLVNHAGKAGKHTRMIMDSLSGGKEVCGCSKWLEKWRLQNNPKAADYMKPNAWPFLSSKTVIEARRENRLVISPTLTNSQHKPWYANRLLRLLSNGLDRVSTTYTHGTWGIEREKDSRSKLTVEFAASHTKYHNYRPVPAITSKEREGRTPVPGGSGGRSKPITVTDYVLTVSRKEWVRLYTVKATMVQGVIIAGIIDTSDDSCWEVKAVQTVNVMRTSRMGEKYQVSVPILANAMIIRSSPKYPFSSLAWL